MLVSYFYIFIATILIIIAFVLNLLASFIECMSEKFINIIKVVAAAWCVYLVLLAVGAIENIFTSLPRILLSLAAIAISLFVLFIFFGAISGIVIEIVLLIISILITICKYLIDLIMIGSSKSILAIYTKIYQINDKLEKSIMKKVK